MGAVISTTPGFWCLHRRDGPDYPAETLVEDIEQKWYTMKEIVNKYSNK